MVKNIENMLQKLPNFKVIILLAVLASFFLLAPSAVSAACSSQDGCSTDKTCYPCSGAQTKIQYVCYKKINGTCTEFDSYFSSCSIHPQCDGGGGGGGGCQETNNSFPSNPGNIYLCRDNVNNCLPLSADPSNPTRVPGASSSSELFIKVDTVNNPAGSQGIKYQFKVDNKTNSFTCTPILTGDYCGQWQESISIGDLRQQVNPAEGTIYDLWVHTGTTNKCDGNIKTNGDANIIHRYFKFNYTPQVVSVTPSSGLSGTETPDDDGPAAVCTDKNPQRYTVTYSDKDGCGDITATGFWADDAVPNTSNISSSVHAMSYLGSIVNIDAGPSNSGSCSSNYPVMQLYVDNKLVKSYLVSSDNRYTYVSKTPLRAEQLKIQMANDCSPSAGNDTNLRVSKITINSDDFRTNADGTQFCMGGSCSTSTQQILYASWDSFKFAGNVAKGRNVFSLYGLNNSGGQQFCGANPGGKCVWGVPDSNGIAAGESSSWLYSAVGNSQSDLSEANDGSGAKWRLISAQCQSGQLKATYEVAYLKDIGKNLNLYGFAMDSLGEIEKRNGGWVDVGDWSVDLVLPNVTMTSNAISKSKIEVSWKVSDDSKILTTGGVAGLFDSDYTNPQQISNLSTNPATILNVPLNSFSTDKLWNRTLSAPFANPVSGKETVDIGTISGGQLRFEASAVDRACNLRAGNSVNDIGSPWLITKAGSVYVGNNIKSPVKSYSDSGLLPKPPSYSWGVGSQPMLSSFSIDKSQTQVSTELLSLGGQSINKIIARSCDSPSACYTPHSLKSYADSNTAPKYLKLMEEYGSKLSTKYVNVQQNSDVLNGSLSAAGCNLASFPCGLKREGNLSVSAGFKCDREAVIFVSGNLELNPAITISGGAKNGCIFVVGGNVTFKDGTNQSAGSAFPKYDLFQAFVIADGKAIFERAPQSQNISDGLKIDGGVIALGGSDADPSVQWLRSLQLADNNEYPSVAIHLDPRYIFIAPDFFDGVFDSYVKETGFKPY